MKKKNQSIRILGYRLYALILILMLGVISVHAQIVTTSPSPLQENSQDVVLYYHADSELGNKALMGLGPNGAIYAHIGAITNLSTSSSDWKYAPSWGNNNAKYKLDYVEGDTWSLTIGDIRTYFGITNENEHVEKIALVFRTADCKKEGKTASGGDIFVDVLQEGFNITLECSQNELVTSPTTVSCTLASTIESSLKITVNGEIIGQAEAATSLEAKFEINAHGSYRIIGTATLGDEILSETIVLTYPNASEPANYPGEKPKMGTVTDAAGNVTFCIAAPGKETAILVPSWDNYEILDNNVMKYQDYEGNRYFWIQVPALPQDQYLPYYFIIDGKKVGDPYAELVLDPYSDKWLDETIWPEMPKYPEQIDNVLLAVYCGKLHDYEFSSFEIPSHDNLVIYELLFRDFTGTEGQSKGDGTVRKAMEKIPYLKQLGVNAIELMPIMEFNGNNSWGYNTNFYFATDKAYGSPLDYKDFIEECHQNGIAVILDIVFNQSDGLHPWYQLYPISSNPFYNASAPHAYSVLNDWKQDNPLVRQQWIDAIEYWMTEYNVDGFRFDLVKGLGDNSSYTGSNTDSYNASRVANMKALNAAIKSVKANGIHINENLAGTKEENEMGADGQLNWSNVNDGSCQYAMGYSDRAQNIKGFYAPAWDRVWNQTVAYAESHDEERMGYKQVAYSPTDIKNNVGIRMKRLGAVATAMLMTPGSKMIWQFGELGADQTTKKSDGNDTGSKKVIWNYLNDEDRAALHSTYLELCNLRTQNPELFTGDYDFYVSDISSFNTRAYRISNGNMEAIAFINAKTSGNSETATIAVKNMTMDNAMLLTSSRDYTGNINIASGNASVSLLPHEYAVYITNNLSGIDNPNIDFANPNVVVYGGIGEIVISGTYNNISVYNVSGSSIGSLNNLPSGIYIVNVDGNAHKVQVK